MGILDVAQRRYLFEKTQPYLFSYDVKFEHDVGVATTSGLRRHLIAEKDKTSVFHVLDDRRVDGNDTPTGKVFSLEETLEVASGDDSAVSSGRMILNVGDGKLFGEWEGVVRLGPGYYDAYVRPGPAIVPVTREVRAQMTVRFQTSNQKYKWLTEQLCAGFGAFTLIAVDAAGKPDAKPDELSLDQFSRATFDIYGLG